MFIVSKYNYINRLSSEESIMFFHDETYKKFNTVSLKKLRTELYSNILEQEILHNSVTGR